MKLFPAISIVVLLISCEDSENQVKDLRDHNITVEDEYIPDDSPSEVEDTTSEFNIANETQTESEWSYKVISISEDNWGYQIFQKGKMMINQTSIPSVQGIDGFDTQEKAERTAKHVLNKVENGIFPPTVDKEELENLGVLRD